eukprot:2705341-Prymnesium_polylepis.1
MPYRRSRWVESRLRRRRPIAALMAIGPVRLQTFSIAADSPHLRPMMAPRLDAYAGGAASGAASPSPRCIISLAAMEVREKVSPRRLDDHLCRVVDSTGGRWPMMSPEA